MPAFKNYGSGFGRWLGPDRDKVYNSQGEPAKLDGWLSGDDAKARYLKAPGTITKVVEDERAKHITCSTDAKPLRVDVERIMDAKTCYLEFSCPVCFKNKRVQVNETTGVVVILKDVIDKLSIDKMPPPVLNPMTKEERIAANVKANAEGRVRYPQIKVPPSFVEQENRLIRDAQYRPMFTAAPMASSATIFGYDEEIFENDGEVKKSAKPLISGGGKIQRKPEPKKPVRSMLDRLRIERAAPAHDEEV